MTLLQCYNKYKGTAILVPGGGADNNGQCVQWADTVLHEVYGLPYFYTPSAVDWWNNFDFSPLKSHFVKITKGKPIKKGDFIIYDPRIGTFRGHIDVASRDSSTLADFWAYDSNWSGKRNSQGYPILEEIHHTGVANTYVLGYLRKKQEEVEMPPTKAEIYAAFEKRMNRKPTSGELKRFDSRPRWEMYDHMAGMNRAALVKESAKVTAVSKQLADCQAGK